MTVLAQLAAVGKLSPAIAARAAGVAAAAELREELLGAPSPRRAAVASGGAEEGSGTAPPGGKTLLDELWELRLVEGALVCSRPQAAGTAPGRRARHAMVASGEKIFIHGGVGTLPPPAVRATSALHYMKGMVNWGAAHDATARPLSELFEFNARTYTWSRLLGGTPPAPRHSHACVVARGGRSLLCPAIAGGMFYYRMYDHKVHFAFTPEHVCTPRF